MTPPFWRCFIISLLLWALPAQWLAVAASLPCIGQAEAKAHTVPTHDHAHAQVHGAAQMADADPEASHSHEDTAAAHSHAQCGTAGHCCLGAALFTSATPDFARCGTSTQFAPLAQPHPTPLLSGPDRPPQTQLA